jgi:hypothetical protein
MVVIYESEGWGKGKGEERYERWYRIMTSVFQTVQQNNILLTRRRKTGKVTRLKYVRHLGGIVQLKMLKVFCVRL